MEHIRTQNIHPRIEIPLVDTLEYDGGDFDTYPERQGWDEDLIFTQRDFGQQPLVVVESFFQRWLYFGFLICTFRIVGISVRTGDFLRTSGEGKQIVTTEKLPRYLQHWRKEYKQDKVKEGGDTKHLHWPRITKILRKVYDYANRYCNEYGQSFEKGSSRSSIQDTFPMSPLTSLSIIALGQAITSAATTIYQTPQADLQMPWGTSSFLRNLLYERGWCPKDISLLCDPRDASIEMQYRLAIMPYSRASTDHRRCTISECVGERVDTDHYSTLHVSTGCTCATPDVEESVLSIIRQGGKPIISITTTITQEAPTIEVVNCERQFPKYVAISHVWADGLGNRQVNGLPICQLRRLQTLVNLLYGSEPDVSLHRSDMPERFTRFWMDTLCVPLHDQECRKLAISEMRDVYALADRVLVLDSWILNGSMEDSIAERSTRLMMSYWARRLWTLSEAVLARNLYIQYGDATEHTETLFAQCKDYYQCGDEFYDSTPAHALVKSLPTLLFGPDDPIFGRFDALVYHIGQRATSWPSDETICFSNILGLSTKTLLDIPREELQTRMPTFLRMVGTFRQQMIFNAGPRCRAEGFGWAPFSFLNKPEATVVTDRGEGDNRVVTLDPCGGLLVTYSGIRLGSVGTWLGRHCVITFSDQKDSGLLCAFRTYGAREAIAPWNPAWDYFVISYTPVTEILGEGPSQSVALIGCLQDVVNGRPKIKSLRKAALLQLSKVQVQQFVQFWSHCPSPSDETDEARLIEGTRLDENQEWCIV